MKIQTVTGTISSDFQIANWTPDYYNNIPDLPTDMPAELKQNITEYYNIYRTLVR